ncbi:glycosyltransferase (plasmid) [Cetobacterium somerae]|uniref:glycosyltransferase family 2 protein n=1 Tax=Cetobacterium somerae TaxID=188913 RepID=UPI002E7B8B15|nr:glycosyltransferase [Cetobacterium somerae]WVJ02309.1 glycosyltransferase [Cetobacterium somerae]
MDEVKISIIIPVYNSEQFLEKCLNSVLNQTLKEIEVIVVNDGSTDSSYKIMKKIIDNRLILINKKNEGVSSARNQALKLVKGKYVLCIDSDDWIDSRYLEDVYLKAEEENLDVVVTNYYYDKQNKSHYMTDLEISEKEIISGEEYIKIFFEKSLKGFNWNKLIKSSLFINNKIYYSKEIKMMEDTLFLIKILKNSKKIGKLNKGYYHYLQHETNATRKINFKHLKSVENVFKELRLEFEDQIELSQIIKEKEVSSLLGVFFNIRKEIKIDYFYKYYIPKIKKIKSKIKEESLKKKIMIKSIQIFPYKFTINIWRQIYCLKNILKRQ